MSLDAMKTVLDAERSAREAYQEASAASRQLIQDAETKGKVYSLHVQADAAREAKRILQEAEEQGKKNQGEILAHAENQCAVLRAHAEAKLPEAVNLIIERIVKS